MPDETADSPARPANAFEAAAAARPRGPLSDLWAFLRHNKKWWLLPIVVVLLLVGILVILAATGAAPFLYPLF